MSTEITVAPAPEVQLASLITPSPKAAKRVLGFPIAQINNDHARNAYLNTPRRFACHESPRTTKLYDRRSNEISLDEVERISM